MTATLTRPVGIAQAAAPEKCSEYSCMLQPSPLGGIGVFATHDIPVGAEVRVFAKEIPPRRAKLKEIPLVFHKFCVFITDEEVLCPERFDLMEIGWYLNHSKNPNIMKISESDVVAIRPILAGEEILLDYNQLNEPNHLKEAYYVN